jgi:hypothetical protein
MSGFPALGGIISTTGIRQRFPDPIIDHHDFSASPTDLKA